MTPAERLVDVEKQLAEDPDDSFLIERRASVHVELQQWDKAIADLRSAITAKPDSASAYVGLASILAYQRDEAGFRSLSRQLLERFDGDWGITEACFLKPEWLDDPKRVELMLEKSLSSSQMGSSLNRFGSEQQEQINRSRLEMLRGQPLLAIQGFGESLTRLESSDRFNFNRDSAVLVRLHLAMALKSIGDDTRAEATLQDAEQALGPVPNSLSSVANHVLLRQAQAKIFGKERTASVMP